jgi:hypothetical protein
MKPNEALLEALDQKRVRKQIRIEQDTDEYREQQRQKRLELRELKRRGVRIFERMNPRYDTGTAYSDWISMGNADGRDDVELFIRCQACVDIGLDIEMKLAGKNDSDISVEKERFMTFWPNLIEDEDKDEITPDHVLWDDATAIIAVLEDNLGIERDE